MLIPHYLQDIPLFAGVIPDIEAVQGTPKVATDFSGYFTNATNYSISPAIEDGWTFGLGNAVLTIDTNGVSVFGPYTVTGTNLVGDVLSNTFNVTVTEFSYNVGENRVISFTAKNRELIL